MDFNSMKRAKPDLVFCKKNIPFVKETIQFQGKPTEVYKANFSQGQASFSCYIKPTENEKYFTKDGHKEIMYYMTLSMFDTHSDNNYKRRR